MAVTTGVVYKYFRQGTAAASGGTFTVDVPIPTSRGARIEVRASMSQQAGGALVFASLKGEGAYKNNSGTVTAVGAISGSTNPMTSTNLVAATPQASDTAFVGGGSGPPTLTWSVSGTNARITVTNNSDSAVSADVSVWVDAWLVGST